jgi:hypothetical protein
MSLKNPVTRPGIDPVTVRVVVQRLKHYATPGPISRNSNDPNLKSHYELFYINLINVIIETKIANYKKPILNSDNKMKTTWNIIKSEIGRKVKKKDTH